MSGSVKAVNREQHDLLDMHVHEEEEKRKEEKKLVNILGDILGNGNESTAGAIPRPKPLEGKPKTERRQEEGRDPVKGKADPKYSPQRTKLAVKLARTLGDEGVRRARRLALLEGKEEPKELQKTSKVAFRVIPPRRPSEGESPSFVEECLTVTKASLERHRSQVKTYEAHVETIMKSPGSVKIDYFNFLNLLIKEKNLGEPLTFTQFSDFYEKLTSLVTLLKSDNLDSYVLRFAEVDSSSDSPSIAQQIRKISHDVVSDLTSFGFKAPTQPVIFWSGSLAKEKAMEDESGLTDEQILLLQALWGFDSLVVKKEEEKPSFTEEKVKNCIHTKLIVAFSSILAEYAEGKEVDYFLGYPDGMLNTSSAFFLGELPVFKSHSK